MNKLAAEVAASTVRMSQALRPLMNPPQPKAMKSVVRAMAGGELSCVRLSSERARCLPGRIPAASTVGRRSTKSRYPVLSSSSAGHLTIVYSPDWTRRALNRDLSLLFASVAVAGLVAFVAAVTAHRWLIGRPVDSIIAAIDARTETGQATLVGAKAHGDMARVIDAYNAMVETETADKAARHHHRECETIPGGGGRRRCTKQRRSLSSWQPSATRSARPPERCAGHDRAAFRRRASRDTARLRGDYSTVGRWAVKADAGHPGLLPTGSRCGNAHSRTLRCAGGRPALQCPSHRWQMPSLLPFTCGQNGFRLDWFWAMATGSGRS